MNSSTIIISILTWILLLNTSKTAARHSTSKSASESSSAARYQNMDEYENQNLGFIVTQMLKRRHGSPSVQSRPLLSFQQQKTASSSPSTVLDLAKVNLNNENENSTQQGVKPVHSPPRRQHQDQNQNISGIVSEVFNDNRNIPVEIPAPIFRNLTRNTDLPRNRYRNQNGTRSTNSSSYSTPHIQINNRNNTINTTSSSLPVENQISTPISDSTVGRKTDSKESQIDSNHNTYATTNEGDLNQVIYNRKLSSVLRKIRRILPILSMLQHNMTDLLNTSRSESSKNNVITTVPEPDNSHSIEVIEDLGEAQNMNESRVLGLSAESHTIESTTQEFSFPIPTTTLLTDEENPEYIHHVIDELYPKDSFENLIKVVKTMPLKSQEIAYEKIADDIVAHLQSNGQDHGHGLKHGHPGVKYGKTKLIKHDIGDLIELSCELYGKSRFQPIIQKYDIFESFAFPTFFRGEKQVYLEAQTRSDGFQNLYFDRSKQTFGITNEPLRGVFQSWSYLPVNDGCYFLLKSFEADFIVGVVVTKSAESPLLAKNVLGIAVPEDGMTNYRFHWRIIAYRDQGTDHALLLLENRETNLVLEWNEEGIVYLNSINYEKNQLWDQGQRLI